MKKESVNKFDLEAAFKALEEIEIPVVKGIKPNRLNLQEHFTKKLTSEALVEDYYDVNDQSELEAAQEEREAEVAKAKLARIEKIVDLDADSEEDLLPSYVGKVIIQCPQCMTLFYKNQEDIEPSEENPEVVNVNEVCQHCGNSSGYTLIGKVDKVGEDEAENYNVEDFDENELNLDFEDAEEPSEEESVEDNVEDVTAEEGNEEEIELEPVEEVEEASEDEEEVKESLNEAKKVQESVADELMPRRSVEIKDKENSKKGIGWLVIYGEKDSLHKEFKNEEEAKKFAKENNGELMPIRTTEVKESVEETYKVVISWSGIFCGEKRAYKNDITYIFDHEPTEQEIADRFENDENIVRLKNWNVNNVRKAVRDFMAGTYDNYDGWKDIKITSYKIIKKAIKSVDKNSSGNFSEAVSLNLIPAIADRFTKSQLAELTPEEIKILQEPHKNRAEVAKIIAKYNPKNKFNEAVKAKTTDKLCSVVLNGRQCFVGTKEECEKFIKDHESEEAAKERGGYKLLNTAEIYVNESLKEYWWEDNDPMNWSDKEPLVYSCYYNSELLGYLEYPYMGYEEYPTTIKADIIKHFELPKDYNPKEISWQYVENDSLDETKPLVQVDESLNESIDKDLDAKLKAHNEYIEYLKKMLEQEEEALSRADNEYVKKAIQRRIDAFKADLEDALPEELKNEVETDLPTAEEINLEATENVEEPKEETKESLKEEKINIDYVVSLFGDDSHYYKEDDVKLSPDISGATKFNKKKDISILDIVKDICEYESKYMPENEVASLFDLNTLEEVYEKDEDYFINSGLVKIITVYKNKKIKLPESLEEAIQKNPNISAEEINKIIKDKKLLQKEKAKKIYEDVKIISDLSDYKPWSGAVDTWNKIQEANKIDELDAMLEEVYPDGLTMTELNDILWFDSDWVLSGLGIIEEVEESLTEDTATSPRVRHQSRREIFAKELALHPAFEGISIRDLERYIIDLYLEDDPDAELNVDQVVEYVEDLGWGKIILDNIDNLSEGQIRHFAQKDPVFVSVVKEFLGDWLTPNKNYSVGALVSELLAFLGKKPADKEEAKDFKFDPNDKSYKEFKDELIDLYYKAKSSAPVKEAVNSSADSLQESGDLDTLLDSEEFKKPISDAEVENIIAKYESLDEDVKPGIESELAIQDIVDTWESIEEIDEESLDKLTENYLTEVYSNVKSFKTTNCALEKNKLVVEGKITFNSGKEKNTKFVFEAKKENNKIILEGLNADFATEKAFVLNCNLDTANRLVVESLNYKYTINNTLVEGLVK